MPFFSDISPGKYLPGNTPAHQMDARLKVLMVAALSVAVWGVESFAGMGLLGALLVVWTLPGGDFLRHLLTSVKSLIYLVLAVAVYFIVSGLLRSGGGCTAGFLDSLLTAALLCGKLTLLWLAAAWLTLCTAPLRVVEALSSLLRPLELARLPVREFSFTVGLILRFFPDSVARIGSFHRQLKMRERLAGQKGTSSRRLGRIIDAMVLYMHYSLYQSELLALSLIARGYNPFRASFTVGLSRPAAWELGAALFSAAVIFVCAWWL